jgi:hypothetical protein
LPGTGMGNSTMLVGKRLAGTPRLALPHSVGCQALSKLGWSVQMAAIAVSDCGQTQLLGCVECARTSATIRRKALVCLSAYSSRATGTPASSACASSGIRERCSCSSIRACTKRQSCSMAAGIPIAPWSMRHQVEGRSTSRHVGGQVRGPARRGPTRSGQRLACGRAPAIGRWRHGAAPPDVSPMWQREGHHHPPASSCRAGRTSCDPDRFPLHGMRHPVDPRPTRGGRAQG